MIIQVGTRERPIIQEVVEANPDADLGDVAHEGYGEHQSRPRLAPAQSQVPIAPRRAHRRGSKLARRRESGARISAVPSRAHLAICEERVDDGRDDEA